MNLKALSRPVPMEMLRMKTTVWKERQGTGALCH